MRADAGSRGAKVLRSGRVIKHGDRFVISGSRKHPLGTRIDCDTVNSGVVTIDDPRLHILGK